MARSKPWVRFRLRLRTHPEDAGMGRILDALPRGELQPFLRALALVGFSAMKKEQAKRGGQGDGRTD